MVEEGGWGRWPPAPRLPYKVAETRQTSHRWLARQQQLLEAPASAIAAHASSAALAYGNGTMQLKPHLHRTGEMTARSRGLTSANGTSATCKRRGLMTDSEPLSNISGWPAYVAE